MLGNFLFYAVAGTIVGAVAGQLGGGIGLSIMASLLVPPILLLAYRLWDRR